MSSNRSQHVNLNVKSKYGKKALKCYYSEMCFNDTYFLQLCISDIDDAGKAVVASKNASCWKDVAFYVRCDVRNNAEVKSKLLFAMILKQFVLFLTISCNKKRKKLKLLVVFDIL